MKQHSLDTGAAHFFLPNLNSDDPYKTLTVQVCDLHLIETVLRQMICRVLCDCCNYRLTTDTNHLVLKRGGGGGGGGGNMYICTS